MKSNVLNYNSFKKVNENANASETSRLQMEKSRLEREISDSQRKLAEINLKLAQGQMDAVKNQAIPKPNAPMQAQPGPQMPGVVESLHTSERDILDYGFDNETFWIGFTDNTEDDVLVSSEEFKNFVVSQKGGVNGEVAFIELDRDSQKELINSFLKTTNH